MKKGVAISYVIAIALGIVVIGIVGYWLFATGGKVGTTMTLQDCRVIVLTKYCPDVIKNGYDDFVKKGYAKGCIGYAAELGVDKKDTVEETCHHKFSVGG